MGIARSLPGHPPWMAGDWWIMATASDRESSMSQHAAARVTDVFGHDAMLEGIALGAGIAVGAMLAAGVVVTGGLGALAVGAAIATSGGIGGLIGKSMDGPATGSLQTGSPSVFINTLPATMVAQATGGCSKDGMTPRRVATGSATVFNNGKPTARVTETMDCGAVIRTGSPNVFIGGPRQSPVCTALRGEETMLAHFAIDAQAASAVYEPPATRKPPDGYRNATPEDLRRLRLNQDMLEHPVDPRTGQATEFRAAVFMNEKTGAPLVAFKGTSPLSGEDWAANVQQGLGHETFYYNQAQKVARQVQKSPAGADARLTGHSLGGGMASAGSAASGLPATTFNAAGLNARTVPHPMPSSIDAVYVEGEILRASQSIPGMPKSAATRTWPLKPADRSRQMAVLALAPLGPIAIGAGIATRSGLLHMMGAVDAALAMKQSNVAKALVANGCS